MKRFCLCIEILLLLLILYLEFLYKKKYIEGLEKKHNGTFNSYPKINGK